MKRGPAGSVKPLKLAAPFPLRRISSLVLPLGTVTSLLVFWSSHSDERASLRREFERRASNVTLRVADYLLRNVDPSVRSTIFSTILGSEPRTIRRGRSHLIPPASPFRLLESIPSMPSADCARTAVCQINVYVLKHFGLTVHSATRGDEGIIFVRDQPVAIDLALLDLTLPGLSGEDTLRLLHALRPQLPVILMSGYGESDILSRLGQHGAVDFLQKLFGRDILRVKLECVFASLAA